jgi:quercetin dioxygenase-like cupin family protein
MSATRRDLCKRLPAFLAAANGLPAAATADDALPSATFEFNKLPVQISDHAQVRHVMKGKLATGEAVEVHETTLPPNGYPHPPHHHAHSEMWLIREGTVELTINGQKQVVHAGGLGFVRSNEEHGIRNVGTSPANYYVVAIGPGADTQA